MLSLTLQIYDNFWVSRLRFTFFSSSPSSFLLQRLAELALLSASAHHAIENGIIFIESILSLVVSAHPNDKEAVLIHRQLRSKTSFTTPHLLLVAMVALDKLPNSRASLFCRNHSMALAACESLWGFSGRRAGLFSKFNLAAHSYTSLKKLASFLFNASHK
jgi:hypothetical protein